MSRLVKQPAAFFSLVLLLVLVPLVIHYARASAVSAALVSPPVLADDVNTALLRAGLDPEALAAVGVSSNAVSGIVSDFRMAMLAEPTRLFTADAEYAAARQESDRLRHLIESGTGAAGDVTSYQSQMQALASATTARASALTAFKAAATGNLTGTQVAMLTTILANRVREIPVEFLVIDRTDAEWVALRDALANEKIAPRYGEQPDAALQATLSTWRANASVAAAKVNLDTNGAAVKTAWSAAVAQ